MCVSLQWNPKPAAAMLVIVIYWYFLLIDKIISKGEVIKNIFITFFFWKVEKIKQLNQLSLLSLLNIHVCLQGTPNNY